MPDTPDEYTQEERERRRHRRLERAQEKRARQFAEAEVRLRARREGWIELAPPDAGSARAIRAMAPRVIGIRSAKARLGELVRDVRAGREWLITDRGRPVARLVAVTLGDLSLSERLRKLEEAGLLEPAPTNPRWPSPIRVRRR